VGPLAAAWELLGQGVGAVGALLQRDTEAEALQLLTRGPALTLWAVTTLLLAAALLMAARRLNRESRRWPLRRVLGRDVRVSDRTGPAVVGISFQVILLPRWLLR